MFIYSRIWIVVFIVTYISRRYNFIIISKTCSIYCHNGFFFFSNYDTIWHRITLAYINIEKDKKNNKNSPKYELLIQENFFRTKKIKTLEIKITELEQDVEKYKSYEKDATEYREFKTTRIYKWLENYRRMKRNIKKIFKIEI